MRLRYRGCPIRNRASFATSRQHLTHQFTTTCIVTRMLLFKFVNPTNGACKTKSKRITEKSNSQIISMEKSISLFRLKMIVDNVAVTLVYALWHITTCAVYVSQLLIIILWFINIFETKYRYTCEYLVLRSRL